MEIGERLVVKYQSLINELQHKNIALEVSCEHKDQELGESYDKIKELEETVEKLQQLANDYAP
jgi:hypothetical protein